MPPRVYHIYVEELHNYAVGNDEWLVHNGHEAGRGGKQARLRELLTDPNVSRADRGWIQQELNQIARGKRNTIRVPGNTHNTGNRGMVLAHRRGYEARKGFGYNYADLQDIGLHLIQHAREGYR